MGRSNLEFCCCAVPLSRIGGYTLVLEGAFVSFIVGILAFAPPPIVAGMGVIPSFAKLIVGLLGFGTFALHIVGLFSLVRSSAPLYRIYIRLHLVLTLLVIALAVVFTVVAAAQHNKALTNCIANYGQSPTGDGTAVTVGAASAASDQVGKDICNIFLWAQTGVMGLLITTMGITQLYMCYAQRVYGQNQRDEIRDYKRYDNPDSIPLSARDSAVWESRPDDRYAYAGATQGGPGDAAHDARRGYSNDGGAAPYDDAEAAAARRYTGYAPYGNEHEHPNPNAYPSYPAYGESARPERSGRY